MLYNILDGGIKRTVNTCNFNQHISDTHPDRIMSEHDLVYIKEGCWSISQDGIDYELSPGDVILLQGGHHHYGKTSCISAVKTCFVHFSSSANDRVSGEPVDDPACFVFPIVVHCQNDPLVEHYFNRMIYAYWSDDDYAAKKASAYLELCLCAISGQRELGSNTSSMVEQIKLLIRKTPERFFSNNELAATYCCSVRTLTTKFKEATGYSLHAWQIRVKCQMAQELMRADPSLTLKEIAAIYGFCDEYHFGKCYKKQFGHSPKRSK